MTKEGTGGYTSVLADREISAEEAVRQSEQTVGALVVPPEIELPPDHRTLSGGLAEFERAREKCPHFKHMGAAALEGYRAGYVAAEQAGTDDEVDDLVGQLVANDAKIKAARTEAPTKPAGYAAHIRPTGLETAKVGRLQPQITEEGSVPQPAVYAETGPAVPKIAGPAGENRPARALFEPRLSEAGLLLQAQEQALDVLEPIQASADGTAWPSHPEAPELPASKPAVPSKVAAKMPRLAVGQDVKPAEEAKPVTEVLPASPAMPRPVAELLALPVTLEAAIGVPGVPDGVREGEDVPVPGMMEAVLVPPQPTFTERLHAAMTEVVEPEQQIEVAVMIANVRELAELVVAKRAAEIPVETPEGVLISPAAELERQLEQKVVQLLHVMQVEHPTEAQVERFIQLLREELQQGSSQLELPLYFDQSMREALRGQSAPDYQWTQVLVIWWVGRVVMRLPAAV